MPITIGKLASSEGVKVSTLRYYERAGLLKPASRSPRGYRLYDSASRERLRFIRTAQATGFSLDDIKALLRLRERADPPCDMVCDLADARLEHIERRLADLRRLRQVLRDARQRCEASEARHTCAVLDQINAGADTSESAS
jgi:DNA-binding transcriptional MerR regulator